MKYLLAFALIAFASAELEPVRLLQPVQIAQPDIVDTVKIVDAPVVANDASDFAVNFDDAAPEVADAPMANDFAVKFVDVAPEIADAPVENDFAIKFVDVAPEVAYAPMENDFAVRFVDNADIDEETPPYVPIDAPFQVKIVDMPLRDSVVMPLDAVVPESVKIADTPVETNADSLVKIVDVAEDAPVYMPPKQYPDPRWR